MDETRAIICPCCGENVTIRIDPSGGRRQSYVEDCQVCCRPWQVTVALDDDDARVDVQALE